jgi:hypothetical protein
MTSNGVPHAAPDLVVIFADRRPTDEVAAKVGKSKAHVYQRLSLTRLAPQVHGFDALLVRTGSTASANL